ncbi:MAG: 4Fe-4S binding protein [Coriobacteriales bacterium]|nr:4Fe-4S binding protein [Coriobacteriales bacterium]
MAITINAEECIGCGACVDSCPLDLIELKAGVAALNDADACIECASCVDACPTNVISL